MVKPNVMFKRITLNPEAIALGRYDAPSVSSIRSAPIDRFIYGNFMDRLCISVECAEKILLTYN